MMNKKKYEQIKKMLKYTRIEVVWQDALAHRDEEKVWYSSDERCDASGAIVHDIGYFLDVTNDTLQIVQGYSQDDDCKGHFVIPIGCIKEIYVLEKVGKKKNDRPKSKKKST